MLSVMALSLAMPLPATSKAVPWSTETRMMGRPSVMLTPEAVARFLVPVEGAYLQRDVALVMVHGNNAVELTALSLGEDTVGRYGTVNIEVAAFQFLDGRNDFLSLLPAEHTVFAAMRIQTGHADVWILNTELAWMTRMFSSASIMAYFLVLVKVA